MYFLEEIEEPEAPHETLYSQMMLGDQVISTLRLPEPSNIFPAWWGTQPLVRDDGKIRGLFHE